MSHPSVASPVYINERRSRILHRDPLRKVRDYALFGQSRTVLKFLNPTGKRVISKKYLRHRRTFSPTLCKYIFRFIESGKLTVAAATRVYHVSASCLFKRTVAHSSTETSIRTTLTAGRCTYYGSLYLAKFVLQADQSNHSVPNRTGGMEVSDSR